MSDESEPSGPRQGQSAVMAFLREPLVHFVAIAALLLAANSWRETIAKPVIEISRTQLMSLAEQYERSRGEPPTRAKWRETIDFLVEEEVLFREARARGLVEDNRVRSALIEMMRSALKPTLREPSDAELEVFRATVAKENFRMPAQIAFEHVSFTSEERVPADLLARLRKDGPQPGMGDAIRLANPLPQTYRPQIEKLLGEVFAEKAFGLPLGDWRGPLKSSLGVHFVRVTARQEPREAPLAEVRHMVRAQWLEHQNDLAIAAEANRLAQRYRVIAPEPPNDMPP